MDSTNGVRRGLPAIRALRHGIATAGLVLLVCIGVGGVSLASFRSATAQIRPLTAIVVGRVTGSGPDGSAQVTWTPRGGTARTSTIALAATPPARGTRTQVAYDPAAPGHALIPGAAVLSQADQAASGVVFSALVGLGVLGFTGWRVASRRRVGRLPGRTRNLRRIRVQSGLLTRSWLETEDEPQRWIPVYFDPSLVTLPAPSQVLLHGDPWRDRLVAAEAGGVLLYPSGPVTAKEPRGRRTDNPAHPDEDASRRAGAITWRRQLRADAVLLIPAPFIGLLWAYLDNGGFPAWLAATLITAAFGLFWAALRGSDPS